MAALKSKIIDPAKCRPRTSLYHQILRNSQSIVDNQNRKFNLGNGRFFTDPIIAADQLLVREYADSALFNTINHEPIFIPPVFQSNQYSKKYSSVHLLDYDVDKTTLQNLLGNLQISFKNHWFALELQSLYNLQAKISVDQINAKEFSDWILSVKIMYLVIKELGTDKVNLPSTISNNDIFIQACIKELALNSPGLALQQTLKTVRNTSFYR